MPFIVTRSNPHRGVSVIIPVFNGAQVIPRALNSVVTQSYRLHEIIVVDDGSTDNLQASIRPFKGRISLIRQSTRRGAAEARNAGMRASTGEFVAFLDADDRWMPEKVSRQLHFMQRRKLDVSCTGCMIFGGPPTSGVRPFPDVLGIDQFIWGCHVCPGSTMVARRSTLLELGGYDARFPRLEDWDLLLRASLAGIRIGYLREPLASVFRSSYPSMSAVNSSLGLMRNKHANTIGLLGRRSAAKFEAAMAFEAAVSAWADRRPIATSVHLGRSLFLAPRQHLPIKMIFLPRVLTDIRIMLIRLLRWSAVST